jgi:protease PrsW
MESDAFFALSLAVLVAFIYLGLLRFADLNEREPVWALALVLFTGAVGAAAVGAVVDDGFRVADDWGTAITAEGTKLLALAVAVVVFALLRAARGWSEMNGPMDGLVYGAAAGLGFATGDALVRELSVLPTVAELAGQHSDLGVLWTTLWTGLSEGLFGAILGAGIAYALYGRSPVARAGAIVLAVVAAVGLHVLYLTLARGNALSGGEGAVRHWIALALPLAAVAALAVYSLRREREAIVRELREEVGDEETLRLLSRPGARRAASVRRLLSGDLEGWYWQRALHTRLVQLAIVAARVRHEPDPERKAEFAEEANALRAGVAAARAGAARPTAAPAVEVTS